MTPITHPFDADLARFCQDLADTAAACSDLTDALLIDAGRRRLNLELPRGGSVLVLRFRSAAAPDRAGPAVAALIAGRQPDAAFTPPPSRPGRNGSEEQP